jgi:hypothetical protein
MNRIKVILTLILFFVTIFVADARIAVFAEEDKLQVLCEKLNDLKRYEGKKIGIDDTKSPSWEIGEQIVAYQDDAIPYLIEIYKNSDSVIAQLFAARLIAEIDPDRGKRLLDSFVDDKRTVETLFDTNIDSMTAADIARKERIIIENEEKRLKSLTDYTKTKISNMEE